MNYAKSVLRSIIAENLYQQDVIDSIKNHNPATIVYDDNDARHVNGKGERLIEPVAFGRTKKGNLCVRAFQPDGSSFRGRPAWKTFTLDNIKQWRTDRGSTFNEPPDMYNAEGRFNRNGDDLMDEVFVIADFNKRQEVIQPRANTNNQRVNQIPSKNRQSARQMSLTKEFGDNTYQPTSGPVTKGNNQSVNNNTKRVNNYDNVISNSPIYKTGGNDENNENENIENNGKSE